MDHPAVKLFEQRAELLGLRQIPKTQEDAIAALAASMGFAAEDLTDRDWVALSEIGGAVYRERLSRRRGRNRGHLNAVLVRRGLLRNTNQQGVSDQSEEEPIMELDMAGRPHLAPLAPRGWTMVMEQDGGLYTAAICYRGEAKCRLSMAGEGLTEGAARTQLADKARLWIAEYLVRTPASAPAPL